jgi:DnaJ family protein C protein 13
MAASSLDNILQRVRTHSERGQAGEASARFLVTKLSWRGNYRRILAITPSGLVTLHPDTNAVTNAWSFTGDHDLAAVEVGGDHADGGVFVLHFRKDKKGLSARDARFACRERGALLSALYAAVGAAAARGQSGLGPTLLGAPPQFRAFKLRKGAWVPVILRVTPTAVERLDADGAAVRWRLPLRHAAAPFARALAPGDAPAGALPFALFGKAGRSPRVYACRERDALLRAAQTAALQKLGLTLAVDASGAGQVTGQQLLAMVAGAERERAAAPTEAPLAEWEVLRLYSIDPGAAAPAAAAARDAPAPRGARAVAQRRLVLTRGGLLERRVADYEVAERRPLASVAALVRFAEDPQWAGVEWADGAPASIYVTPARDQLLAALMDACQVAAGRPVPLLPAPTGGGEPLVARRGQAPGAAAVEEGGEVERVMVGQLSAAARDFLAAGGGTASIAALALAGLEPAPAAPARPGGSDDGEAPPAEGAADGAALAAFQARTREFNASVPYAGVCSSE